MREIKTAEITDVVERLCIEANEAAAGGHQRSHPPLQSM